MGICPRLDDAGSACEEIYNRRIDEIEQPFEDRQFILYVNVINIDIKLQTDGVIIYS